MAQQEHVARDGPRSGRRAGLRRPTSRAWTLRWSAVSAVRCVPRHDRNATAGLC